MAGWREEEAAAAAADVLVEGGEGPPPVVVHHGARLVACVVDWRSSLCWQALGGRWSEGRSHPQAC